MFIIPLMLVSGNRKHTEIIFGVVLQRLFTNLFNVGIWIRRHCLLNFFIKLEVLLLIYKKYDKQKLLGRFIISCSINFFNFSSSNSLLGDIISFHCLRCTVHCFIAFGFNASNSIISCFENRFNWIVSSCDTYNLQNII